MNKKIAKSLTAKYCIRFATNHPDGDEYDGIVIHKTNTLVFISVVDDFEVDGMLVLPRKRIAKVRDSEYEECENRIIRGNSEIRKVKTPKWLNNIKTMKDYIKYLLKRKIWPIVEMIDSDNNNSLYIGPLISAGNTSFTINCYDATGEWEQEYTLPYSEIFKVEIDSKYANHFNSYMKGT